MLKIEGWLLRGQSPKNILRTPVVWTIVRLSVVEPTNRCSGIEAAQGVSTAFLPARSSLCNSGYLHPDRNQLPSDNFICAMFAPGLLWGLTTELCYLSAFAARPPVGNVNPHKGKAVIGCSVSVPSSTGKHARFLHPNRPASIQLSVEAALLRPLVEAMRVVSVPFLQYSRERQFTPPPRHQISLSRTRGAAQ